MWILNEFMVNFYIKLYIKNIFSIFHCEIKFIFPSIIKLSKFSWIVTLSITIHYISINFWFICEKVFKALYILFWNLLIKSIIKILNTSTSSTLSTNKITLLCKIILNIFRCNSTSNKHILIFILYIIN